MLSLKKKKSAKNDAGTEVPIARVGGAKGLWLRIRTDKRFRTVLIVIGVVVLAFIIGFSYRQYHLAQQRKDAEQAQLDRILLDTTLNKATDQMLAGNYDEADKTLQEYLDKKPRKEYLVSVYSAQAINDLNNGKPEDAKAHFEEARKHASDIERYGVLTGLAQVEVQLGNKDQAIKYYEEAIASLGTIAQDDVNTQGEKARTEYRIQQLKEQQ